MVISRQREPPVLALKVSGQPIEQVKTYKYLGVTISEDLSWGLHRVIDGTVTEAAKQYRHNLVACWVDFQKAYDRVPHLWVKVMLQAIRAPRVVQKGLASVMARWIELPSDGGTHRIPVQFERGLHQGDSLSPLLFCLCVAPVSFALNAGGGFRSEFQEERVSHLMFMDDLKMYEESLAEMEATAGMVEGVAEALGMKFGVKKCGVASMRGGAKEGSPRVDPTLQKWEMLRATGTWEWTRCLETRRR